MPHMGAKVIFTVICVAIVIQLCTGATIMNRRGTLREKGGMIVIRRSEEPRIFWYAIGFQCLILIFSLLYIWHVIR
jgi:hypothetical protein